MKVLALYSENLGSLFMMIITDVVSSIYENKLEKGQRRRQRNMESRFCHPT